MKSTEYQTDEDCVRFKRNTTALKKEINSLVTNPPVPGCGLKHSKQLKSHLLFDGEIHDFLVTWRTLGGVDEQNIEGVHPQFNALVRRFACTRGGRRQELIMREFLFSHSAWMAGTIDKLISDSRRQWKKKRSKENCDVSPTNGVDDKPDGIDALLPSNTNEQGGDVFGGQGGAEEAEVVDESRGANVEAETLRREDEEEEECGAVVPLSADLMDLEKDINNNVEIHSFENLNTKTHACRICKQRLLTFAMKIHHHECHKVHFQETVEDARA